MKQLIQIMPSLMLSIIVFLFNVNVIFIFIFIFIQLVYQLTECESFFLSLIFLSILPVYDSFRLYAEPIIFILLFCQDLTGQDFFKSRFGWNVVTNVQC